MRILKNIFLFQKKIFFKSYLLSLIAGAIMGGKPVLVAIHLFFIAPFVQYSVYDLSNKNEYYYYYNLGLSKTTLWLSTIGICIINFFMLMCV